jgi:hypothetical protein
MSIEVQETLNIPNSKQKICLLVIDVFAVNEIAHHVTYGNFFYIKNILVYEYLVSGSFLEISRGSSFLKWRSNDEGALHSKKKKKM